MYAYVEDCRQAGVTVEMDYEQCGMYNWPPYFYIRH